MTLTLTYIAVAVVLLLAVALLARHVWRVEELLQEQRDQLAHLAGRSPVTVSPDKSGQVLADSLHPP